MPTILRPRRDGDNEALYRLLSDLDSWEQRTLLPPTALSAGGCLALLDGNEAGGAVEFVIDADGAAVGRASLLGFDALARHAEVGIALLPEARGRGIGTDALLLLVEFGFVRRNLHRIHLGVLASNATAIRSYEKVGFVHEGRKREACWVRGHYEDDLVMGLLRAEWAAGAGRSVGDLGGA